MNNNSLPLGGNAMKSVIVLPLMTALLFGCLPEQQPKQIVVDGEASLEFEPDTFSLSASLRARTESQEDALADIAQRLSTVRDSLPLLDGLTHLTINASTVGITPIQDPDCQESRRYNLEELCPVIGYFGSVSLGIKGSPASASGIALSLVSELGAESVSLSQYSLSELDKAKQDALDSAVRDAREKAKKIASAAGTSVIGPIRIQYGEGFSESGYGIMAYSPAADSIVVSGSRVIRPDTNLDLDPQPIKIEAKVVAAFEIE